MILPFEVFIRSLLSILIFFLSTQAFASGDLRLTFGRVFGSSDELNEGIPSGAKLQGINVIGMDLIGNPVFLGGLGAGFRVEDFSSRADQGSDEHSFNTSALSLLLNYRIINTGIYAGPILALGLITDSKIERAINGETKKEYTADKNTLGSLGFEGGAKLGFLGVGAEAGLLYLKAEDFRDKDGNLYMNTQGQNRVANYKNPYIKLHLGLSF